jgi:hypothetical protein
MNKTGALFVYNRAGIGYGVHQKLQIANPPDAGLGNFIGVPAYDPVNNQIYVGSTDDSAADPYRHGLLAFHVVADCLLSLSWQQTFGVTNLLDQNNPVIPPVVANGVVYYAAGDSSQVVAFDVAAARAGTGPRSIEIELAGAVVRVMSGVDGESLTVVLRAVRCSSGAT